MVFDRTRDEDDPLAQQPRIDVEAALSPVRLLDDDGDELRNDVLMIDHWKWVLLLMPAYIGAKSRRFKAVPPKEMGGPDYPNRPFEILRPRFSTSR
jgi:hypothetical protein